MTTPTKEASADSVHRLIDMVVEEVSLVDRAANKHRFLIVKRNEAMDDDTDLAAKASPEPETTDDSEDETEEATKQEPPMLADGSPLGAAVAALESLTAIVELLGSLGAERSDTRLAALAQQLRATAEQILERTGFSAGGAGTEASDAPADDAAPDEVSASAKAEPEAGSKPSEFANDVAAAKRALERLTELAAKGLPRAAEKPAVAAPPADTTSPVTESLAKLAESFRTLSEAVKEQHQRLGRVEKQFGLPNSTAPGEHVSKAADADVGWPLDLNKPKDRESVDKAVSFHDL
ncbi:MAG: hypothetical protein JW751_26525 [Polyangiaceae bacterium]|nr:hypothetical protein [Polyangiaceae bacterium]